jgi:hypothetical protein
VPSTVVHVAFGWLLAVALLGAAFDRRALLVSTVVGIVPDLDVFAGFLIAGGHRSVLHTFWIPIVAGALLYYDTTSREASLARSRLGTDRLGLAWAAIAVYAVAGIGLDLVTGGANVFYPVVDQFFRFDGRFVLSSRNGVVQTFIERQQETGTVDAGQMGSTQTVHINSGVDPTRGAEPEGVNRIFPVVQSGWQLLVVVTSIVVVGVRLRLRETYQ